VLAHWDEVESRHVGRGHLGARWTDLGRAAGTRTVGLRRIRIEPGKWSTPLHLHTAEEEIFYVLGGSGTSLQEEGAYEVGPGDCLVHGAYGDAHTLRAGEDGLDALAFGTRVASEAGALPRAGVAWLGVSWVELDPGAHPWEREADAGPPEVPELAPRPRSIVNVADAEDRGGWRDLGRAAGSELTGLKHVTVPPRKLNCPPHCHAAAEEIFVVLEGEGAVELLPSPALREDGKQPESHPVRRGTVVSRPAGTGVAHAFRAGADGLVLLAYGTRDSRDVLYYPRSNKIYFRGVGVMTRVEHLPYDLDEPDE
jgi:uncharacterized cupin superfamily protein